MFDNNKVGPLKLNSFISSFLLYSYTTCEKIKNLVLQMLNEGGTLRDLLNYVQGWYTELLSEQLCTAIKLHRLWLNMKITGYRVWNLSSKEKSSLYAVKNCRKKGKRRNCPNLHWVEKVFGTPPLRRWSTTLHST